MSRASDITQATCLELFVYSNGKLYNKVTRSSRAVKGTEAGGSSGVKAYLRIKIGGHNYAVHRLIYFMQHGYMPELVDHINGDKLDNHITNLRACTNTENSYNSAVNYSSCSGVKGATWDKGKWRMRIQARGKSYHLGYVAGLELAALILSEAREVLHGEYANDG